MIPEKAVRYVHERNYVAADCIITPCIDANKIRSLYFIYYTLIDLNFSLVASVFFSKKRKYLQKHIYTFVTIVLIYFNLY